MKLISPVVCAELCFPPLLRGSHRPLLGTCLTHSVCHPCEPVSWKDALFACVSYRTWSAHWPLFCSLPTFVLENSHLVLAVGERQGFPPAHLSPLGRLISKWQEVQRSLSGQENVLRPPCHLIWILGHTLGQRTQWHIRWCPGQVSGGFVILKE